MPSPITERERLARMAHASLKRSRRPVRHRVLCERLGLGEHGDEVDTPKLRNARRQLFLDVKHDVFRLGFIQDGSQWDIAVG